MEWLALFQILFSKSNYKFHHQRVAYTFANLFR